MKFQITIDRDEEGVWIAECPAIPEFGKSSIKSMRGIALEKEDLIGMKSLSGQ